MPDWWWNPLCMQDYDERGDYIRTWVPELAKVPAPSLFEPWRLSRADQEAFGVQIGVRTCHLAALFSVLLSLPDMVCTSHVSAMLHPRLNAVHVRRPAIK